jgi:hypothetical protein
MLVVGEREDLPRQIHFNFHTKHTQSGTRDKYFTMYLRSGKSIMNSHCSVRRVRERGDCIWLLFVKFIDVSITTHFVQREFQTSLSPQHESTHRIFIFAMVFVIIEPT